ncbi:unnamed protein product [Sphenostylis stenocarpa]|uniref:Uncharacterized protein n=1 Tax=Sphenostylis stenocarpa TaxID=92480 RepID=A0AA86VI83_9FABA|nr:unnamed protein product [Sphenostylis stenocarpa]
MCFVKLIGGVSFRFVMASWTLMLLNGCAALVHADNEIFGFGYMDCFDLTLNITFEAAIKVCPRSFN